MTTFSIKGLNKERLAEKILRVTRGNSTPEQSETDKTIALIETLEERAGSDRIHGDNDGVLMSCAYELALEQLQETEDKLCEANLTIDRYAREAAAKQMAHSTQLMSIRDELKDIKETLNATHGAMGRIKMFLRADEEGKPVNLNRWRVPESRYPEEID